MSKTEMQQEALSRAVNPIGAVTNYPTIYQEFSERGIPMDDIKPRENVFTFQAWKALGRHVRKGEADSVMRKWDGGLVYNFGAAFVCPRYDAELDSLIVARDRAEYTGTAEDYKRIKAIYARLETVGGLSLHWN